MGMKRTIIALAIISVLLPLSAAGSTEQTENGDTTAKIRGRRQTTAVADNAAADSTALASPRNDANTSSAKAAADTADTAVSASENENTSAATSSVVVPKRKFLPMRNRVDREINKNTFVYKGEVMVGATISYGSLTSDDTDLYLVLDNLKLSGSIVTVNPFIGYFVANDHAIGLRFGYSRIDGKLGNATLDLGEENDIEMSFGNMRFTSDNYSFGIYHRSYVPLDARGRFGLFSEVELMAVTGSQLFRYKSGDSWKETNSDIFRVKFNFSPGLAVYIFPNVCGTISFGLGGLQYNKIKQYDGDGEHIGSRTTSKMRFRLNLADIRIGMNLHLWNKKKP